MIWSGKVPKVAVCLDGLVCIGIRSIVTGVPKHRVEWSVEGEFSTDTSFLGRVR